MSRIAPPSEKIMAVASIYKALSGEIGDWIVLDDPRLQVQMLATATTIAMGTDTRDMGIIGMPPLTDEAEAALLKARTPDPGDHHVYPEIDEPEAPSGGPD